MGTYFYPIHWVHQRAQPPHHNRGEDQELGPGLEECILLSPSFMTFTTLIDALSY